MISFNGVSEQLYIPEEQIKDIYNASKGKSKKEQAQIVKANVEHYRKELDKRLKNNTFAPVEKVKVNKEKPKKVKKEELRDESGKILNTFEYSYWLYNQGNTVERIAEKRGLNPTTIESHLARYVASGDIDVHEFVDADTLEKVDVYCEKHPERIILILDIREYSVSKNARFTHDMTKFELHPKSWTQNQLL